MFSIPANVNANQEGTHAVPEQHQRHILVGRAHHLVHLAQVYAESGLSNPAVIIDTNHANSGKKYLEQIRIAKDVVHSRNQNNDIKKLVKGLMIESYLEDGAQSTGEHVFGKSITDPCLGWDKTERLILDIAELL